MKRFADIFHSASSKKGSKDSESAPESYWSLGTDQLLSALKTSNKGLSQAEAEERLKQYGLNALEERHKVNAFGLFLNQFKSPLVLILIAATIISILVGEWTDASIILAVVLGSTILGFVQEYNASNAVEKLRSQVAINSNIQRDGQTRVLPSVQIAPGDIVQL